MDASSRSAGPGTQTVERALSLLTYFTDEQPERRIAELVDLTGLGQSTVSRLVGALESLGYLARDERTGLHRLGPRLVGLAGVALNQSPVHRASRQIAQNLAHETGLGANVSERQGDQMFYLCHFEGPRAPRSFTLIGRLAPLHATAMGKALLSGMKDDEVAALLGRTYPAYTKHTFTDLDALVASLDEVRRLGYATEIEELALGRACLAVPVRDRSGDIVAALSVSGSLSAMDLTHRADELGSLVIEQADQVSTSLGYLH
ncbi:IclR family transcriptional regulator [Streptomyces sp. cg28]|uniref:IclR family transcriptional regulator n=1 Tax=Streptomyces sp. cg28 TaxID=3403457 RepID=UPI003B21652E